MATEQNLDRTAMCKHLRSKEMYYTVVGRTQENYESAIFWCNKTLGDVGPDGTSCDLEDCLRSRGCFEE